MKVQSVRRYIRPRYPTCDYLTEHPELLGLIPERWRHNRLVLAVLSMVALLILSRQSLATDEDKAVPSASRVAPLFVHGDGRGAFGCVVVNPPVFLSEDEARQVILDEAKNVDLDFAADTLTLKDVTVPVTDKFDSLDERDTAKDSVTKGEKTTKTIRTQKRDLVLDGYDHKHGVAYEVISKKDFDEWERGRNTTVTRTNSNGNVQIISSFSMSSVSRYDFKAVAETLTNGLAQTKGQAVLAVFYEPCAHAPKMDRLKVDATEADQKAYWLKREKAAKQLGAEELRQQVRDFIQWLKAQGVI